MGGFDQAGGGPPSGPAGGDLTGTYPDPTIDKVGGVDLDLTGGATGDVLTQQVDGSYEPQAPGGSTPGATRLLGPFSFAFDTVGLDTGIPVGFTPAVGDVLVNAFLVITTTWDAAAGSWDLGGFTGGAVVGIAGSVNNPANFLQVGAPADVSAGGWRSNSLTNLDMASWLASAGAYRFASLAAAAVPLKLVVSLDGTTTGGSVGGTAGAADLYLVVATPAPL